MTKLLHRYIFSTVCFFRLSIRVSDQHHFNADPDPSFHFIEEPAPTYCSSIEVMRICAHWVYRQTLHASIASVQDSPRFHFELLNFDLYTDPDPAFHFNGDPDPDLD